LLQVFFAESGRAHRVQILHLHWCDLPDWPWGKDGHMMADLGRHGGGHCHDSKGIVMKDFVISVNNTVLYIALGVIWLTAIVMLFNSFLVGVGTFVVGTLSWCIVSGFWFVQSATYEELRKLNSKSN